MSTLKTGIVRPNLCSDVSTHALRRYRRPPLPHVVNPAVHADGHEHVEVDPQREPLFHFLITQPVNDFWFVQLSFQTVPQVPRYLKGGHKHANRV